jgi:hypothetical protein
MQSVQFLEQFIITFLLLIPVILISRTVVAGTRYSPILIIVVFGLTMGLALVGSNVTTPGLPDFPVVDLMSKVTITALIASFFVGGQELKRIFTKQSMKIDEMVVPSSDEIFLGTKQTQFVYLIRSFFILIGIEGAKRLLLGASDGDSLSGFYPLIAYLGFVGSVILIDFKAHIKNKRLYIYKGVIEFGFILGVLLISHYIAVWIKPVIGLPQIFFAMIISASLGVALSRWVFGPTIRSLLFAGIPVVLAANFIIGGSRIVEAFKLVSMYPVMTYGFFGQLFWMFGGISLLIFLGLANHVRNLAPGMAGALSHSGLTGACTAGDFGDEAASRAPIMINIPFFGHIFVFSILAASASNGSLLMPWAVSVAIVGVFLTAWSVKVLRKAEGKEEIEVKGLMIFSFGWQLTAIFGSFLLLNFSGMPLPDAAMASSSALSHFGLFAAIQGEMFGLQAANLIAFIFAMPFLVHPLVFGMFGRAAENNGVMPPRIALGLALIGLAGIMYVGLFA